MTYTEHDTLKELIDKLESNEDDDASLREAVILLLKLAWESGLE